MSDSILSRRSFVATSTVLGLSAAVPVRARINDDEPGVSSFPHQSPEMVQAVVGASHTSLEKVKELVEKCPPLARASWDWGFGDWESALGAASHTGQREIALYLMTHGARPDIFAFAMLGNLAAVQAMIATQPGLQRTAGPHGIPLLQHARAGGTAAAEVFKYLQSLGDAGQEPENYSLTPGQAEGLAGEYRVEGADGVKCVVKSFKGGLVIQCGDEPHRGLMNRAANEFSPVGAPEVRLVFEVKDGRAVSFSSRGFEPSFKAIRAD